MPRQVRSVTSKTSSRIALCSGVSFGADGPRIGVLQLVPTGLQLSTVRRIPSRMSSGFELVTTIGTSISLRAVFGRAHHGADMAGGEKGLNPAPRRFHDRRDRRRHQNVGCQR